MTNAQEPRTPTIAAQIEALHALPSPKPASVGILRDLTVKEIERDGAMSSTMVRAGLLLDILDELYAHRARANLLPAIVTALRQAEAAPGVVEAEREEAAMRVAKAFYGENFDPFTNPESFEICQTLADAALARQHEAREDAPPSADAAMVEALEALLLYADPSGEGTYDGATDIVGVKASGQMVLKGSFITACIRALQALASRQPAGVPEGDWMRDAYIEGFKQALYNSTLPPEDFFDAWVGMGCPLEPVKPLPAAPATDEGEAGNVEG